MGLVRITAVEYGREQGGRVHAYAIDAPTAGAESDRDGIVLDGWVLGAERTGRRLCAVRPLAAARHLH